MVSVMDVAKYILEKRGKTIIWKLQRLIYYVQFWSVVRMGGPFFCEPVLAYNGGPAVKVLHDEIWRLLMVDANDLKVGDSAILGDSRKAFVDLVLDRYGWLSMGELDSLGQSVGPWRSVFWGKDSSVVISTDAMLEYYRSNEHMFEG